MIWDPEKEKNSEIHFKNALTFGAIFIGMELLFSTILLLSPSSSFWTSFIMLLVLGLLTSALVTALFVCE